MTVLCAVLDPAAHLDPGPAGHDIYGPTGQALARVCVPLDPQTVLGNLKIEWPVKNGATHILKRCRNLLASYLNGSASTGIYIYHLRVIHFFSIPYVAPEDACIASSQLPLLINSYNEAICQLKDISEACVRELTASARELTASARELTASAMSDLGNLYFMAHNNKSVASLKSICVHLSPGSSCGLYFGNGILSLWDIQLYFDW